MQHKYNARTRLFELVNDDTSLLSTVSRFGISLGFGEKNIAEVCNQHGIDTTTFLAVINFIAEGELEVQEINYTISLDTVISYLRNSHNYFLDFKLPLIREKLDHLIKDETKFNDYRIVLLKFFDDYVEEVKKHMEYEDKTVFPYVIDLIGGKKNEHYSILDFEEHHTDVDSKLSELKNILIKYHPASSVNFQLNDILFDLLSCEKDLATHNIIEDFFFVPLVESYENKFSN